MHCLQKFLHQAFPLGRTFWLSTLFLLQNRKETPTPAAQYCKGSRRAGTPTQGKHNRTQDILQFGQLLKVAELGCALQTSCFGGITGPRSLPYCINHVPYFLHFLMFWHLGALLAPPPMASQFLETLKDPPASVLFTCQPTIPKPTPPNTPISFLTGLLHSRPIFLCSSHLQARHQTTQDSLYTPKSAKIIQTRQP